MLYLATEHTLLTTGQREPVSTVLNLPGEAFSALKAYALREDAEPVLRYFVQRGQPYLRVGAYAGLLQAGPGVSIEVLPRLTGDLTPDTIAEARTALLRMLLAIPALFPRILPEAAIGQLSGLALPEVLTALFLKQADRLLHRGIQSDYRTLEAELPYLKGKLQLHRAPYGQPDPSGRLPVVYDERSANNAPNRLLKACLLRLQHGAYARVIRQYLFAMEEINTPANWQEDLKSARRQDRSFRAYEWLWPWAEWFLGGRAPGFTSGGNRLPGLLFPTQGLFEQYVAIHMKRYLPTACEVKIQNSAHYLLSDPEGRPAHRLRPDIVVRQGEQVWVLDTKWKQVQNSGQRLALLSQSDLYQMYAYGQRYAGDAVTGTRLALIYPRTEAFATPPQPYLYEAHLPLYLLPADLRVPASQMVAQLWSSLEH